MDLSDSKWTVTYNVNNLVVTITNGRIQTNGFSGSVVLTALVYYDGVLVANVIKNLWVGAPQATLVIDGLRDGYIKCQGESMYFNATSLQGFPTSYTWTIYQNLVNEIYTERTAEPFLSDPNLANLSVGDYIVSVRVCNDCGCNESSYIPISIISKDERCRTLDEGRGKIQIKNTLVRTELAIYPNPVNSQLTIKLPSLYHENPMQVELYNSIGQLVYSKDYTETTIEFSVSTFPKGLYVLKIQNGNEIRTKKIIIE